MDDKTKVGGADRHSINVHEGYEVRDWCESLGVTPERLKEAVAAVGPSAEKVREWLRGAGDPADSSHTPDPA